MKTNKIKERNLKVRDQKANEQREYSSWKKEIKDHEQD